MTHFKWLKKEIPRWVKEEIITREAGDSLISLYRNEERHSHGEGLFVLAAVCFLTGLIFICAGVWNGLSQDEQFMMALVPLVLSILIIAAILWQDRPVMDRIPAESVRLEEAENTAELLSGKIGGTVSAGSGIEENTAAGNKGKDLSSLLPSVSYRHRVPDVIREAAGVFHGVAVLCAVWMVNESFKLSGDWFVLAAVSCVFLLLMSWAFPTAGLGMVYMASSVLVYRLSPYRGWPEAAAWVFLVLALPLLVRLLGERRHKAVVCYSWFWAVCVLLLIYWTASNLLWQTMFFALAAALTWMAGSSFLPGARRRKRFASLAARPCSAFCWRAPGVPCGKAFQEIGSYGFCFSSFLLLTLSCLPGWVSNGTGWLLSEVLRLLSCLWRHPLPFLKQPVCLLPSLCPSLPRFLPWQLSGGGTGAIPTC